MKNATKKFTAMLIAILALAVVPSAFAQIVRSADMQRVEEIRATARQMHAGHVVEAMDATVSQAPQAVSSKLFIFSDKKYYLPGEEIKIRAMGLAADANQLQIYISERYTDSQGTTSYQPSYLCECGDSNGGSVPSLTSFNFITLINKRVPQAIGSKYDFVVTAYRFPGNGQPGVWYQTTPLTVFIGINYVQENNPIRIDQMIQGVGAFPILFLTGRFPVNVPLYYFVGAAPYDGGFSSQPQPVSTDGYTLIIPGMYNGTGMEGRVVLMLPDGSFSTTSPQTFVPLPASSTGPPTVNKQ